MSYRCPAALMLATGLSLSYVPLAGAQSFANETFTLASGNYPTSLIGANTVSSGFAGPWTISDPSQSDQFVLTGPQDSNVVPGLIGADTTAFIGGSTTAVASRQLDVASHAFDSIRSSTPGGGGGAVIGAPGTSVWLAFTVSTPPYSGMPLNVSFSDGGSPNPVATAFGVTFANSPFFGPEVGLNVGGTFAGANLLYPQRGDNEVIAMRVDYQAHDAQVSLFVNPLPAGSTGSLISQASVLVMDSSSFGGSGLPLFNQVSVASAGLGVDGAIGNLRVGASYADVAPSQLISPSAWQGDAPGDWYYAGRWTQGVPAGQFSAALLGQSSVPRSIQLSVDVPVQSVTFDSNFPYTVTGPGNFTGPYGVGGVASGTGTAAVPMQINVLRGSHTIDTLITGSATVDIRIRPGAFLTVRAINATQEKVEGGGTLAVKQGVVAYQDYGWDVLTVTGGSTAILYGATTDQRAFGGPYANEFYYANFPNVRVDAGSQLILRQAGATDQLVVAADGTFAIDGLLRVDPAVGTRPVVLFASANAQFGPAGKIDLTSNIAFVYVADLPGLTADLLAGKYFSSLAGSNGPTGAETLALVQQQYDPYTGAKLVALPDELGAPDFSAFIVYTYFGDTNLDGVVDATDIANFTKGEVDGSLVSGWAWGDFNYDGKTDDADYALLLLGLGQQGSPLGFNTIGVAPPVPEPAWLPLLAAPLGLLGRRRRAI